MTGSHAIIVVNNSINANVLYEIMIDQIENPDVQNDDRHVFIVVEGLSGNVILVSDINYDFSFKNIKFCFYFFTLNIYIFLYFLGIILIH